MNINLEVTRKFYEDNDRLSEFYKLYVCSECKYCDACKSLRDDSVRVKCSEYTSRGTRYIDDSNDRWGEMSYYRYKPYGTLTNSQRMRRERSGK